MLLCQRSKVSLFASGFPCDEILRNFGVTLGLPCDEDHLQNQNVSAPGCVTGSVYPL